MNKVAAFALRRKALVFERERTEHRITLAYAGKRICAYRFDLYGRDHPRVCGEKEPLLYTYQDAGGSPPRMRGKGGELSGRVRPQGITPAYAGKRARPRPRWVKFKDHPRVCGEKPHFGQGRTVNLGSPPRMRGKGVNPGNHRVAMGITPAYAGKSRTRQYQPQ